MSDETVVETLEVEQISWDPNFPIPAGVDAAAVHKSILDLPEGEAKPNALFEAAKDEGHPAHKVFVWDVNAAAYAHNLSIARGIIRSIRIKYKERPVVEKAFYSVKTIDRPRAYHSDQRVFNDPVLRDALLTEALQDLKTWYKKYQHLNSIAGVTGKIRLILEEENISL